jgi:cytoskeletal protein RodZ
MTESMEKILKQARLDKNITIDDAARDLRIRKEIFKQFERKIPDPLGVYELGYLRSYAKYLNIDINGYIAHRKSEALSTAQEKKEASQNLLFKKMKTSPVSISIVVSVILAIVSVIFLGVMNKQKPSLSQDQTTVTQEESTPESQTTLSIAKKGPYEYIVSGIDSNSDINIVAIANTNFKIIDQSKNKTITSGSILTGERLSVPKYQGDTLLIQTTIPDAFDIQQLIQDK